MTSDLWQINSGSRWFVIQSRQAMAEEKRGGDQNGKQKVQAKKQMSLSPCQLEGPVVVKGQTTPEGMPSVRDQTRGKVESLMMQSQARAHASVSGNSVPTPLPVQLVVGSLPTGIRLTMGMLLSHGANLWSWSVQTVWLKWWWEWRRLLTLMEQVSLASMRLRSSTSLCLHWDVLLACSFQPSLLQLPHQSYCMQWIQVGWHSKRRQLMTSQLMLPVLWQAMQALWVQQGPQYMKVACKMSWTDLAQPSKWVEGMCRPLQLVESACKPLTLRPIGLHSSFVE